MGAQSQRVDPNGIDADGRAAERRSAGYPIPASQISPQALALLNYYPLPNFDRQHALQLPDSADRRPAPGQPASAHEQAGQEESVLGHDGAAEHPHGQYEPVRVSGYRQDAGHEPAAGLETPVHAASLRQLRLSVQPVFVHQHSLFRESRKRRGPGGDHRQQSGSAELGAAGALFRQRNFRPERFAVLGDSQPNRAAFRSMACGIADATISPTERTSAGSSSTRCRNRTRAGSFQFTGLAAGSDFGGFLLGVPDAASIAFGNADKYFRSSSYDAFVRTIGACGRRSR